MDSSVLERIEAEIKQLPFEQQVSLMERLAHRIRESAIEPQRTFQNALTAMADDPDIQREIKKIEREFAGVEADGLEIDP